MCRAVFLLLAVLSAAVPLPLAQQPASKLVFADFEKIENGRPVSSRGGFVVLYAYEEDHVHRSTFKGAEGLTPPAPELVRIKPDDPNHAMKFEYSLLAPNKWSGVAVEIHGHPDADEKPVPDDVSGYKFLSLQVYATGIRILRLEARSNASGRDTRSVHPMMTFEVKPGLNTYRVPLSGFVQPSYADIRVDPKDVFKKLTSIALVAFCDECEQNKSGMIVVDNVVFEK
ncbi:MAG TPA: hypothetical protein VEL51_21705 [Vicinamibacterales bacterium]|nr:hypothetical protein [Vicinamibacterales bacterium]